MDADSVALAEDLLRRMGVAGDEALSWATAVGAVQLMVRRSNDGHWEDWHSEKSGLSDGEMMRSNAAMTRLVHDQINLRGTNWVHIAELLTHPERKIPDGRTLVTYTGTRRLRDLQESVHATGEYLDDLQATLGARATATLIASMTGIWGKRWHGMPEWPRIVGTFVAAVSDPLHPHWPGVANHAALEVRPPLISDPAELRTLLLAGPDHLDAESAAWCIQALLPYVRTEAHRD